MERRFEVRKQEILKESAMKSVVRLMKLPEEVDREFRYRANGTKTYDRTRAKVV